PELGEVNEQSARDTRTDRWSALEDGVRFAAFGVGFEQTIDLVIQPLDPALEDSDQTRDIASDRLGLSPDVITRP
ncbi:MAG: hypothetical protein ACYSUI_18010, partial [Planctomycetota bacterium]